MRLFNNISPTQGEDTLYAAINKLADRLGTASTPRSLCESGQDSEDYEWLRQWGQGLEPSIPYWWLNNMGFGGALLDSPLRLSRFEGLGCLLLLFMTEVGRREAREGHIWPAIRAILRPDTQKLLFDDLGQPLQPLKDAMEAAADRFTLRHAFGREGTLSYYVSVYLQFGFTQAGVTRLPYWLAGYGTTEAITYLLDSDLGSKSFQHLWHTLHNYRLGTISPDQARQSIATSPWVLPGWTEELLRWSRERPDVGTAPLGHEATGDGPSPGWIEKPWLRWEPPAKPVFVTRLINLSAYGLTSERYDVVLNGAIVVATLLRQLNGSYFGANDIALGCDNPQPLLSLVEPEGTVHVSAEVQLWEPQEEVTIFDASSGRRIDAWNDAMSTNRAYAVLAACDLEVTPAPAVFQVVSNGKERLSLISAPWPSETRLLLDGEEFWTPAVFNGRGRRSNEPEWTRRVHVHAAPLYAHLGQSIHPVVRGLADDIIVRSARLGGHQFDVAQNRTTANLSAVKLSVELAMAPLTFTLVLQRGDETARVRRVLDPPIDIVGMMRRCGMGWEMVPEEQTLTVRDASAYPYKVLLPRADRDSTRDLSIVEGSVFTRPLGRAAASLAGLEGLGAPLQIVRGPYNSTDSPLTLSTQVVDPGVVQSIKYTEHGFLFIHLYDTLTPGAEHCVVCWRPQSEPRIIPSTGITIRGDRTWQIEYDGQPLSTLMVGIAYDGYRIGASWPQALKDITIDTGKRQPSEALETIAALIRWMHVPILSRGYLDAVRSFAREHPAETMVAWLLGEGLPGDLRFRATNEAWIAATRQVFAGWQPTTDVARDIVETLSRDAVNGWDEPLAAALPWLLRWNPLLMGHIVHKWLMSPPSGRQQPIVAQIRALQRQVAGLRPSDPDDLLQQRQQERLQYAAQAMQVDDRFLTSGIVAKALASLRGQELSSVDAANVAVSLAVASFRDYLGLRVLDTMTSLA